MIKVLSHIRVPFIACSMAKGRRGRNVKAAATPQRGVLGRWGAVCMAVIAAAAVSGCPPSDGEGDGDSLDPRRNMTVQSRDEVLKVTLPADLHVHRHAGAIQGVSADGHFRVHVEHGADDHLMRLVGHAKEVLGKRDWDILLEKHYAHAVELRLKRGGGSGTEPEARTIWWVKANERVLTCDGVAAEVAEARVGASFRALCQGVSMKSPPPPPPPDAADGSSGDGDVAQDGDVTEDRGPAAPGGTTP